MDIELLEKAVNNNNNLSIINTNIQEIKDKKNTILQQLGLNREYLKDYHKKLKNYRYIENIKELKFGSHIRWINLNKINEIKITNGAILCDIKILDKGIAIILKGYRNHHLTLYLNENILFQKISEEENILLKTFEFLNKK